MLEVCIEEKVPIETALYKPDALAKRIKQSGLPWIHKAARAKDAGHAAFLGAEGVMMCSAFLTTEESPISREEKNAMLDLGLDDAEFRHRVMTPRIFDPEKPKRPEGKTNWAHTVSFAVAGIGRVQTVDELLGGMMAAVATLTALYGSEIRRNGEHVDVSAFEIIRGHIDRSGTDLIAYQYTGDYDVRSAAVSKMYPQGVHPCKDGYIDISGSGPFFPRTARMLGRPELIDTYGARKPRSIRTCWRNSTQRSIIPG